MAPSCGAKLANVHFWCHLIGGIGMGAFMGMAGLQHASPDDLFQTASIGLHDPRGAERCSLFVALIAFLVNIVA